MSSSTATSQLTKSAVTLKGSAQIVAEFFDYGINSILYQRGIYPPESFTRKQEYGLTLLMSTDKKVSKFISDILAQVKDWLEKKQVKKLVVVLLDVDTNEVLERWEFNIEVEDDAKEGAKENLGGNNMDKSDAKAGSEKKQEKDVAKIKQEIRDVIRQITASVTFLPLLDCLCTFDVLIYTPDNTEVPQEWKESDAKIITNSEEVKLRSFSTGVHKVDTAVSYKADL